MLTLHNIQKSDDQSNQGLLKACFTITCKPVLSDDCMSSNTVGNCHFITCVQAHDTAYLQI